MTNSGQPTKNDINDIFEGFWFTMLCLGILLYLTDRLVTHFVQGFSLHVNVCVSQQLCVLCFFFGFFCLFCPILVYFYFIFIIVAVVWMPEREKRCGFGWVEKWGKIWAEWRQGKLEFEHTVLKNKTTAKLFPVKRKPMAEKDADSTEEATTVVLQEVQSMPVKLPSK